MKRKKTILTSICIAVSLFFALFTTSCGGRPFDYQESNIPIQETASNSSEVSSSPQATAPQTTPEVNAPEVPTPEPSAETEPEEEPVLNPDYVFEPTIFMYKIGSDHVTCQADYGLNAGFESKGANYRTSMKGRDFYSISFALYTNIDYSELRVTDRETGEDLAGVDNCAIKVVGGRTNYERGEYVDNCDRDGCDLHNFKIVILNSLEKEYTIEQLKIELRGDGPRGKQVNWTEATPMGTADDLPISINEHIKYRFIKIGTEYYYVDYPVGFGGGGNEDQRHHTSPEMTCLSRYYSHSLCETGITSEAIQIFDKKTWQPVELPPGLALYYDEEYEQNILQFRVGVKRIDKKLCSREEMDEFFYNSVFAVNINGENMFVQ